MIVFCNDKIICKTFIVLPQHYLGARKGSNYDNGVQGDKSNLFPLLSKELVF